MKNKTKKILEEKENRIRYLNGYKVIYKPGHPNAMTSENWNGFIYEHVYVASDELGRPLAKGEEVHHLDLNRSNNNPDNLVVLSSSSHTKIHNWINAGAKFTKPVGNHKVHPKTPTRYCLEESCTNIVKNKHSEFCSVECLNKSKIQKSSRPDLETLKNDIQELSMKSVGRKYGVSDNTARKWCKSYGILDLAKNKRS